MSRKISKTAKTFTKSVRC